MIPCRSFVAEKSDAQVCTSAKISVFIRVLIVAEVGIKLGNMTGKLTSELLILKIATQIKSDKAINVISGMLNTLKEAEKINPKLKQLCTSPPIFGTAVIIPED